MAKRLQRTIYIGAGGTGIETVIKVRNYFKGLTKDGSLPPMIKCLFVDTDENTILNLDRTITNDEILSLAERNARAIYMAHTKTYSTYTNTSKIRALVNGAGQFRSHGRFAIMCKENGAGKGNVQSFFSQKFQNLYQEIMNIHAGDENPEFETMGNDVEVHLAFSMSGGTGAGTFLSMAYLIRQIVPQCKIIAYAFSPSFFMNLPIRDQIQQNTYASLLELDYCMSSDDPQYQDIKYPAENEIRRAPFDVVMYVDNKTYSANGERRPHVYTGDGAKNQVEQNVAYAMAVSAGDMGANNRSVLDNWIESIMGGQYDVPFGEPRRQKKAWVSSLGVSEIKCEPSAEQIYFANNLSLRILRSLAEKGKVIDSASKMAYTWVKELELNENGGEEDNDSVINKIISPDEFLRIIAREVDQNNIDSGYNTYEARASKSFPQNLIEQRKNNLVSEKKKAFLEKIQEAVFGSGVDTISVSDTIAIVNQFVKYLDEYSSILGTEINEREAKQNANKKNWEMTKEEMNDVMSSRFKLNRSSQIASLESALRALAQKRFENDTEIKRRKEAIEVFGKISTYASEVSKALNNLLSRIKDAINIEEDNITAINTTPIDSEDRWGTIDLTQKVSGLPMDVDAIPIRQADFFKVTGYNSILEMSADCDNIAELAERYAKGLFKQNSTFSQESIHPIVRVMKNLSKEERQKYLQKAELYSIPLMEIQDYGEDVRTTQNICVAMPDGVNGDSELRELIKDALKTEVQIKWVDIDDPNRILIYRQIGVIPPYFIDGISSGRNDISLYASCQEAFERKDNLESYCPFTDTQFDAVYHKMGFSLESNKRDISEDLLLWLKSMVLNLIIRDNSGNYKIESKSGELDMNDESWRSFKFLGSNRAEAFKEFSKDAILRKEIDAKICELTKDEDNEKMWLKYSSDRSLYGNDFIDRKSEEWLIPAVKKQCEDEMKALQ